jgi:hypothetical protein
MLAHRVEESVKAEPIGVGAHVVSAQAAGRICEHPACNTRLSVYNDGRRCALHDFRVVGSCAHRRRRRSDRDKAA